LSSGLNTVDLRDRDLISIQEARDLVAGAIDAQKTFATFSQHRVDAVVEACASAAADTAQTLARAAVEETGFGNVADKTAKNRLASLDVARAIRGLRTVGIVREDRERGVLEVASPVGVVAAVIPSTNPTSTAIYKTLIALKARNAIVLSPHPSAIRAICQVASVLRHAAASAGAPEGLIGCMQRTTLAGTQELMSHRGIGVILATGGPGLVRAAYSSGKPAYGVGPGNVPAFIERTADVGKAIADIFAGKTFDYGTICSSEQAIVVEEPLCEAALEECRRQGGYFLSADEAGKVGALVRPPGSHAPNTKIVGQPATRVAEVAGFPVPARTRVLIARLEPGQVGREFPLSAEKLSPILAFYVVTNLAAGISLSTRLLEFGGLGHTCAIHSRNDAAIREFGQAVPAFRICVNTSAVHGSIGYSTNLFPAMTLGCGALGGNITSDNIGPQHLMNIKRIAWESRPVQHRTVPAEARMSGAQGEAMPTEGGEVRVAAIAADAREARTVANPETTAMAPIEPAVTINFKTRNQAQNEPVASHTEPPAKTGAPIAYAQLDRSRIAETVGRVLAERGIVRGSGAGLTPQAPNVDGREGTSAGSACIPLAGAGTGVAASSPREIATEIASRFFRSPHNAAEQPGSSVPGLAEAPPSPPRGAPAIEASPFVSENDVRRALARSAQIFIGPKTIVTPAARDLGREHAIFVDTEGASQG
jgi:acetaldehyde dehydrogenase (acetylating)